MGLLRRTKIRTPVSASAHVLKTSVRPTGSAETITMELRVEADGYEPWEVRHQCMAYRSQWPEEGDVLPATFDADDRSRLKVDVGRARIRDAMPFEVRHERHEAQVQVVDVSGDPAAIKAVERQVGMDLDGDGRVG